MNTDFLRKQERIALQLKRLYKSYGYKEYKLSSFEEYSLYAENESFLPGKDMITFTAGGKLMALRPDVTLSVVKNVRAEEGTQKLFYDEKVYRPRHGGEFAEISQIGVEVIGEADVVAEAEAVELIKATLAALGGNFVLDLSHIGITEKVLNFLGLFGADRDFAIECLTGKNTHDFTRFAETRNISPQKIEIFNKLMTLPSSPGEALEELEKLEKAPAIAAEVAELKRLISLLEDCSSVEINFSIVGNPEYYNGVIFKGYVEGVPQAVLSGGRYDKLLTKFRKDGQAIGFALYLGELERYFNDAADEYDLVILYDDETAQKAIKYARECRAGDKRVLLTRRAPANCRAKCVRAGDINGGTDK